MDGTAGDGTTALHWAAYHQQAQLASALLDAGSSVNAANDLGVTALWVASQNGHAPTVRRLLDAGADVGLALLAGETALMVAARSGAVEVLDLLLAHGANPEARGTRGQTALMWAVAQHHPDAVARLPEERRAAAKARQRAKAARNRIFKDHVHKAQKKAWAMRPEGKEKHAQHDAAAFGSRTGARRMRRSPSLVNPLASTSKTTEKASTNSSFWSLSLIHI